MISRTIVRTAVRQASHYGDIWPSETRLLGVFIDPAFASKLPLYERPFLDNAKANINNSFQYVARKIAQQAQRAKPLEKNDFDALIAFIKRSRCGTAFCLLWDLCEEGEL